MAIPGSQHVCGPTGRPSEGFDVDPDEAFGDCTVSEPTAGASDAVVSAINVVAFALRHDPDSESGTGRLESEE
jgi:hypothetical protein